MHEPPSGPELLDVARRTLLEELLPALPPEKHYAALMAANAITIAARLSRAVPGWQDGLTERARALTKEAEPEGEARAIWSSLSAEIRAGRHDPGAPTHASARSLLEDYAAARCAISSPKAIGRRA